jgi:hypothetical protein
VAKEPCCTHVTVTLATAARALQNRSLTFKRRFATLVGEKMPEEFGVTDVKQEKLKAEPTEVDMPS